MDWYFDCKRISKQEVIENLAEVELLCQSKDIHCWCSHSLERPHFTDCRDMPIIAVVLWLTKLFNFSQIFVCHHGHGSPAAFFVVSRARVTILRDNATNASVIPLFVWKFFCNLSTGLSFLSETRNNKRQIVFCENHCQCNYQMRYLHSSLI